MPTFRGAGMNGYAVERQGTILVEFTAKTGGAYQWKEKQFFALSVDEVGEILCLAPDNELQFAHDRSAWSGGQSDDEAAADDDRKVFQVSALCETDDAVVFSLTTNRGSVSTPVKLPELMVMKSLMNYMVPHLLGWGAMVDPTLAMKSAESSNYFGGGGRGSSGSQPPVAQGTAGPGDWPF